MSDEAAASPTHAWSDSPEANYVNGIPSQSLTLAAPLRLAGQAVAPVLSFRHQYDFASGDSGNVELSVNNGADWTSLATFTGQSGDWRRGRISLAPYTDATAVLVRFRLTTDASGQADGWHVDDISVAESPTVVPAPTLDQVTSHTIRLNWAASTDALFSHYAIFRSTASGVGINATLVTTISNQTLTTFTDTGLALDTVYYYRVYAVNPYGTFSPDSALESTIRTLNNPLPFGDDFEATLDEWNLTGTWGITTNEAHSGRASLADSPGTTYGNSSDSSAQTAVNLAGTSWPVLKFWDRFNVAANDWGRVEVSTDGNAWTYVYGIAGARDEWAEQSIDLSPWKNQANLRIRFHLWTDSNTTEDGWSIDDVQVVEHPPVSVTLPFAEGFEGNLSNWLHSSWFIDTNEAYAGQGAAKDAPGVRMGPDVQHWLVLGGELTLTNVVNPQLVFFVKGHLHYKSYFRVQYSKDGGLTWPELSAANLNYDSSWDWQRMQVSLDQFVGQTVRLRFAVSDNSSAPDVEVQLDKIILEEMPAAVTLETTVPHLRSVDLTWTPSILGDAFQRYEVYQATHANVTVSDTLIGTFTDPNITTLTDSGLSIGATYYYKVFTFDTNDVAAPSNERSTTTVPVTLPLVDGMDNADQWVTTGSWGIATNGTHSGSGCLADSPVGDYANSTDTYALTAVNMSGSIWPVLKFWDRFSLAANDWGRVEVSTDGNTWTSVYGISDTRHEWAEQSIDLSPWKNQANLRIRFHLWTDGNTTDDGWLIDDVQVLEHVPVTINVPFAEGFEGDLSHWLHSSWLIDTNDAYTGQGAAKDAPGVRMGPDVQHWLVLGGELTLTNVVSPQLVFFVKGHLHYKSYFRVQYSADGGLTWPDLSAANLNYDADWDWRRLQVSLESLVGKTVRLRFAVTDNNSAPDVEVLLDQIILEETPAVVTLETTVPHLRSVDLTWTPSGLGAAFQRYEVYQATHANVTIDDTLIGTFIEPNDTTQTDTDLSIGTTYYYKVFTVDTNDVYAPSNERSTTTVPVTLPLVDGMESTAQWVTTGDWGIATNGTHGGDGCLADSPVGDYANSTDTYALTAVNLSGSTWPVLKFWDRFSVAANDWGRVEVSTDGNTWTACLWHCGRARRMGGAEHRLVALEEPGQPSDPVPFLDRYHYDGRRLADRRGPGGRTHAGGNYLALQ